MNEETKLIFTQLENALKKLEEVAVLPLGPQKFEIDLTIHRFEFTIELFWKALRKQLLDEYGINVNSPKPVLQKAYLNNLIENEEIWLAMLDDRNLTSHTYKEALAHEVYENIKRYTPFLRKSFNKLL
jgi:nucleotidyltransferase substrate binding protein (TIGR01987 family)